MPTGLSALALHPAKGLDAVMTPVPRFVIDLVARARVGRLRQRLRHLGDGAAAQLDVLRHLLERFERTDFGRQHGLTARTTAEEFRARVPLRNAAEFRAWTERMAGGEENVLWPGQCRLFAYSAGTVANSPRLVPVTPEQLQHFRRALTDTLLLHASRVHATTVFHGRHLHAGGSTQLTAARGVFAGHLDAIAGLALSGWAEKNLYAPAVDLARLPEGPEKTAALAAEWTGRNVRLAAGSPSALLELAGALEPRGGLRGAWPQLECLLTTGAPPLLHQAELLQRLGSGATLHEAYAAVEGFFAAQDGEPGAGLRLLADAGVYFEFLPLRDLAAGAAEAGSRPPPASAAVSSATRSASSPLRRRGCFSSAAPSNGSTPSARAWMSATSPRPCSKSARATTGMRSTFTSRPTLSDRRRARRAATNGGSSCVRARCAPRPDRCCPPNSTPSSANGTAATRDGGPTARSMRRSCASSSRGRLRNVRGCIRRPADRAGSPAAAATGKSPTSSPASPASTRARRLPRSADECKKGRPAGRPR
jgi:hypothetical protein